MMNTPSPAAPEGRLPALVSWVALCFAAAAGGVFFSPDDWYARLVKPVWQPPAWLFGPIWTILYIVMAVAAWLVWCEGGWLKQGRSLGWFLGQWLCNAMLFVGLHRVGLAMVDMVLLWLALVVTVVLFWRVRRTAGVLMLPYLAWVSFAAVLNFALWRLNP